MRRGLLAAPLGLLMLIAPAMARSADNMSPSATDNREVVVTAARRVWPQLGWWAVAYQAALLALTIASGVWSLIQPRGVERL